MTRQRRILAALGLAVAFAVTTAAAQQPQPQPRPQPAAQQPQPAAQPGLPPGHPPVPPMPGRPGTSPTRPIIRPLPTRPPNIPPGRPIGPGGRQFPPARPIPLPGHGGRGLPGHGGRGLPAPVHAPQTKHASHGEAHCPGHGPNDPPPPVNWWRGLFKVDNEKAVEGGFLNELLYRFHDEDDPCNPKNMPPPFLAAVINVGLLGLILYRFGRKPLADALLKRKQEIMREIDTASRLKDESEKRLHEYEEKLENLEETLEELKTEYAAQAEAEKKSLLAELETRRVRMRRDAEFRIEQELKAARVELLQEAVRGAVASAERLLQKQTTPADLDRLAEEYLSAIPAAVRTGAGT